MAGLKIAIIGGGSSYTPELAEGFINNYSTLPVTEVALVDVKEGEDKVKIIEGLVQRMFQKAGLDTKVYYTLDRKSAIKDCSYVITQFRVGGLDARASDEKIPLKYDTVGQETTGPGGFAKALRTVPVVLSIAKEMEELCPDAWLINFTNPSGIVTEAVLKNTKIRCIGLCNVPINMERDLAESMKINKEDIYCQFVGLNHLSWITKVYNKGEDITNNLFTQKLFKDDMLKNIPSVPGSEEIIEWLKLIPSPYLNYFYFRNEMVKEEKESLEKGEGTRADKVKAVEKELFELYADPELNKKPEQLSERGGSLYSEVAISLINSIHNNLNKMHVVNVMNNGAITDLPNDCVIETNSIINSAGPHPIASGKLPEQVRALVVTVKQYEQYAIKAAMEGDREAAFMALLNNPLVHGADVAKKLLEDILEANKKHLPQFFPEV